MLLFGRKVNFYSHTWNERFHPKMAGPNIGTNDISIKKDSSGSMYLVMCDRWLISFVFGLVLSLNGSPWAWGLGFQMSLNIRLVSQLPKNAFNTYRLFLSRVGGDMMFACM